MDDNLPLFISILILSAAGVTALIGTFDATPSSFAMVGICAVVAIVGIYRRVRAPRKPKLDSHDLYMRDLENHRD